ncbi:hypothetical protein QVD17_25008 [Tagetes erecta]|uniref:Bifunctional inhibitor/plant lipid transfer protein/seed storage helical domain-containing protein n=1 Tax=Tagetes erecta TaxID=13708 RepID=A0AAD8NVA5_TARER|nr:hypothetical protein QVD17_25008 [Tagetes erecta]
MKNLFLVVLCALVMALLTSNVQEINAQTPPPITCDAQRLASCAGTILFGTRPAFNSTCCKGLRQQEPCFCQFKNNPTYGQFITSPNAQIFPSACNVTIPTNC